MARCEQAEPRQHCYTSDAHKCRAANRQTAENAYFKHVHGLQVMALLDGGGYAEQAVAPEGFIMHIPDRLGFEEAAGIPEVCVLQHAGATQHAGVAPAQAPAGASKTSAGPQPGLVVALIDAALLGWLLHVSS